MGDRSLLDFVLARLTEEETHAIRCGEVFPSPWDVTDRGYEALVKADAPGYYTVATLTQEQFPRGHWLGERLEHVAAFDPARTARDIAFKRDLVEREIKQVDFPVVDWCGSCRGPVEECTLLRRMAAVWCDHRDFEERWLRP